MGLALSLVAGFFGYTRLAKRSGLLVLLTMITIATLPIGELLLWPLEAEYPPRDAPVTIDGIVVLGGVEDLRTTALWGQPQVNAAAERLTAAAALAIQYPAARVIFSGGSGRLRDATAGYLKGPNVALEFFKSFGISAGRITWENQSRSTAENARLSFAVAAPKSHETWVLITSAFHMSRAKASFAAVGWPNIIPYPVDFRTGDFSSGIGWNLSGNLETINIAIKEWVGRVAYQITGR